MKFLRIVTSAVIEGSRDVLYEDKTTKIKYIFQHLDFAKYNEIHIYFCNSQTHVNYRIWNELHA